MKDLGVMIDDKHSYRDYELIMNNISIGLPSVKTEYVDVPGRIGKLDLSESLTGGVVYGNREISIAFTLVSEKSTLLEKISTINNAIHGKRVRLTFDFEDGYYYEGRATVDTIDLYRASKIKIKFDCGPYKKRLNQITIRKSISNYDSIILSSNRIFDFKINAYSQDLRIRYNGSDIKLKTGINNFPELIFHGGSKSVSVYGNGDIYISYTEGVI